MFDRSAHLYDLLYDTIKDYEAEARELVELIRERNPDASSLLDVACGTGRHLELMRDAFTEVAGVDAETDMVDIARRRLPGVPVNVADMRTFELGRTFDAVTCLFSSVGYLNDADELTRAIGGMAAHLAPCGVLVIDGWIRPDAWWPGINVHALAASADDIAAARVARTWRDGDRTFLEMRYLSATAEGFDEAEEVHAMTLFTDEQYRAAFHAAGLRAEVLAGPMGPGRDRYVAVAP